MVKRKKELWVRTANAIAFILMLFGVLPLGLPDHHVGAAVRGVLPVLRGVMEATAWAPAAPQAAANCGRAQADSTAC